MNKDTYFEDMTEDGLEMLGEYLDLDAELQ